MRELSKKYSIKRKCAFWPIRTVLESFHLGQANDEVHQSLALKRPACPYDQVHILSPKDITCRASLRGTCDSAMIAWKSAVPTVEKSKSESLTCLSFALFPITAVGMYNSGMCCISVFNSRSFYLKMLRINLLLLLCVYAWYVCVGWVSVPGCVCTSKDNFIIESLLAFYLYVGSRVWSKSLGLYFTCPFDRIDVRFALVPFVT